VTGGALKLVARDGGGRETIGGLAVTGDIVGDVAALDGCPQDLDAVAASRSSVLGVDSATLLSALSADPKAALVVARALAQRLRRAGAVAHERATGEVPARLAARLLDLAETLGESNGATLELHLPLAQDDLARLAGMSRESACKTLRKFKTAGLVDYRGRRLKIIRPDALEQIRESGGDLSAARVSAPSR
jgi:CRP-like cAMP-binding protein